MNKIQNIIIFSHNCYWCQKELITPIRNVLGCPKMDTLVAHRDAVNVWELLHTVGARPDVQGLGMPRSAVSTGGTRNSRGGLVRFFSYRALCMLFETYMYSVPLKIAVNELS